MVRQRAIRLSHKSVGGVAIGKYSLENNKLSQRRSAVALVIAQYSDSMLDRDTTFCLEVCQDMRLCPRKLQYAPLDLLSSILET